MDKIIFINPPITMRDRFGDLASAGNNMPFLGLLYLAAMTREHGYKTKVIDCPAENLTLKKTLTIIRNEKPEYVGITASTLSIHSASELAKYIKKLFPEVTIILGGPHVSALPKKTLELFEDIDIGVLCEGEITIIKLLDALKNNQDLSKINGIVYRDNKKIVQTPPRELIKDLDELPLPAFDLVDIKNYSSLAYNINDVPTASIIASRGCPFRCKFCDRITFGNKVRRHSNKYILGMMEYLVNRFNIKELIIYDDMFTSYKKEVTELCKLIKEKGWDLRWSCNVRVDSIDEEMIRLFKDSGCYQINFGIESGSRKILNSVNKYIDLIEARKKIEIAYNAGLRVRGYFIMGFPEETRETILETIKYVKTLKLTDFQLTFLMPFPGSEIYSEAKRKGTFEDNWRKMSYMHCVYTPPNISKKELESYINKARRAFYLRPTPIIDYLKQIRSLKDFKKLVRVGLAFLKSQF